jgi:hypothetical protein
LGTSRRPTWRKKIQDSSDRSSYKNFSIILKCKNIDICVKTNI